MAAFTKLSVNYLTRPGIGLLVGIIYGRTVRASDAI